MNHEFDSDQDYMDSIAEEPEVIDSEEKSIRETPGALGWLPDQRDFTPDPPALLDPYSVMYMRAMVLDAKDNGDRPWPYDPDLMC